MTVLELLNAILDRYPGANPDAMASFKPVYYARFERREGPHLAIAFNECCASFKPTARQPFPIPADIEAHMPSLKSVGDDSAGPPIRDKLQTRHARARVFLTDWERGQGAKIKAQRAVQLYAACWLEAFDQAKTKALDERVTAIVLSQAKVNECFQRAISTERVRRHGRLSADPVRHWQQLVEIAAEWKLEITPEWWSEDMAKSLAERDAA